MLETLVGHFIESFEEYPLPVDVSDEAFKRLLGLVEKATKSLHGSPADQLKTLNEIAATELA
jgi:hypothetical protein